MPTYRLTRRRAQLALLARACEVRSPARVRSLTSGRSAPSRLLRLTGDSLYLEHGAEETPRDRVSVSFTIDDQECSFRSEPLAGGGPELRLRLPLCVEPVTERLQLRARFDGNRPLATITPILSPGRRERHPVAGVHARRLFTIAPAADRMRLGEAAWAAIPGVRDGRPHEFVLRLSRVRLLADGSRICVWKLCAGDAAAADRPAFADLLRAQAGALTAVAGGVSCS